MEGIKEPKNATVSFSCSVIKSNLLILCLSLLFWNHHVVLGQEREFSILDFGAWSDGTTLSTIPFQKAIDSAAKHQGVVVVPSGKFLVGTLFLKSKITIKFEPGSVLLGSVNLDDYPYLESTHKYGVKGAKLRALFWACDLENIKITGQGQINGQGGHQVFELTQIQKPDRPMLIRMVSCKNVSISDISLKDSPNWVQQYVNCEGLSIRNIDVHSFVNRNNDGLDIVGCRSVLISGCKIWSDDDGIVIKTLSDAKAENILITDCLLGSNCNAIKIGTETLADICQVVVSHCIIQSSGEMSHIWQRKIGLCGVALESVDGAHVEQIQVSHILITGVYTPFFIRLGNRGELYSSNKPSSGVGTIKFVSMSHIQGEAERAPEISISGIPGHPIEHLSLDHINLKMRGGGEQTLNGIKPAENEKAYPEVKMFGASLPASSMFFRHVSHLKISNLNLELAKPDARPYLYFEDVNQGRFSDWYFNDASASPSILRVKSSSNLSFSVFKSNPCVPFIWFDGPKPVQLNIDFSNWNCSRFLKIR